MTGAELDLFLAALKAKPLGEKASEATRAAVSRARLWVAKHLPLGSDAQAEALAAITEAGKVAERAPERAAQLLRAAITQDTTQAPLLGSTPAFPELAASEFERLLVEGDLRAQAFAEEAAKAWEDYHALVALAEGAGRFGMAVLLAALP